MTDDAARRAHRESGVAVGHGRMRTTVGAALREAASRLRDRHESPRLDAEVLLAHALGETWEHLHAWPESALTAEQAARYRALVSRRATGEPVAYITGWREFWSLELRVSTDTLIPRPETECLVEAALAHLPAEDPASAADLGTGSGAVALALAVERPHCRVVATDVSASALAVARENAAALAARNVVLREGDWCEALGGECFDVIACNPPYVADADPHLERGDVAFEPTLALAAGPAGLDALRRVARDARRHLHPGGALVLEHGPGQDEPMRTLLARLGYARVRTYRDLAGSPRVIGARWPGS